MRIGSVGSTGNSTGPHLHVENDAVEKINAGAALVYALYYAPPDVIKNLPTAVAKALHQAQRAYGVGVHSPSDNAWP